MDIMTHAKFHFNRLMLTLIFDVWASAPLGHGERLKRPGRLMGLIKRFVTSLQLLEAYCLETWIRWEK